MSTFAASKACGACKAAVLPMVAPQVSSGCLERVVSFSGGRSAIVLQERSYYPLTERTANHSRAPTQLRRTNLGKLATGRSGCWKRAAGHTAVTASISVRPPILPMTDHLLILKGSEEDAQQEINKAGGQILHWFGDSIFVATLGQGFDVHSLINASPLPEDHDGSTIMHSLIQAWRDMKKDEPASAEKLPAKHWDAPGMSPPGGIAKAESPMGSANSSAKTGVKYLEGKVGLAVIIVSGPPDLPQEIKPDEATAIETQIQIGSNFWAGEEPLANVQFVRPDQNLRVKIEPPLPPAPPPTDEQIVSLALNVLSKDKKTPPYTKVADLLTDLFPDTETWAYAVIVTKYNLTQYASFDVGGRVILLGLANKGTTTWPADLSSVFAHETGHIFGALDEYASNCTCDVDTTSAVPVINGNCENCKTGPLTDCIMKNNDLVICPYTRGQVGWDWWGYSSPIGGGPVGGENVPSLTLASPALASNATKLFLAWKGSNMEGVLIQTSTDEGKTWGVPSSLGEMTEAGTGPRLAFFKNMLYMAFVAPDGKHIMVKSSPVETDWETDSTPVNETSEYEPSLAVFNNTLYMAFRVADGSQRIGIKSTLDGKTWGDTTLLDPTWLTRLAPALCTLPGDTPTLFLAFQSCDNPQSIHVITSSDGTNFGNEVTATSYHTQNEGPALGALKQRMYMVFPLTSPLEQFDQKMMYLSSRADNKWSPAPRFLSGEDKTDQTPSLVADTTGDLLMAFKGVATKAINTVRMGGAVAY